MKIVSLILLGAFLYGVGEQYGESIVNIVSNTLAVHNNYTGGIYEDAPLPPLRPLPDGHDHGSQYHYYSPGD